MEGGREGAEWEEDRQEEAQTPPRHTHHGQGCVAKLALASATAMTRERHGTLQRVPTPPPPTTTTTTHTHTHTHTLHARLRLGLFVRADRPRRTTANRCAIVSLLSS